MNLLAFCSGGRGGEPTPALGSNATIGISVVAMSMVESRVPDQLSHSMCHYRVPQIQAMILYLLLMQRLRIILEWRLYGDLQVYSFPEGQSAQVMSNVLHRSVEGDINASG